jgi:hypothetical protein
MNGKDILCGTLLALRSNADAPRAWIRKGRLQIAPQPPLLVDPLDAGRQAYACGAPSPSGAPSAAGLGAGL